ncbi:MAG TPA: zf-HC2 domain-containing protein [Gemmatimonadales bacterium]|jgi:hypothetical protein|nr:zf-HC2 domain-containing protein [Gemmatimonadales bacterium]
MKDQWTDRLSEYLDSELAGGDRTALEAHLATCGECRTTLAELRRVVARAKSLEDRPPRTDLWPGVAERIGAGKVVALPRRRLSFSVPQLIAASVALVLLSGAAVRLALEPPREPVDGGPRGGVQVVSWPGRTDAAIAELENALAQNESRLDTATVRVVKENLAVIDRAVAEARRALAVDPNNTYLNRHLAETMRRKVELLRRVNAIATAQS